MHVVLHPEQHENLIRDVYEALGHFGVQQTYITCSKHSIGGKGCTYKFNNLFLDVWCVIKFEHLSMHLHFTYSPYWLWDLVTNGVWILSIHWVWHLNITNIFWLWSNISPSGWSWCHCQIIGLIYPIMFNCSVKSHLIKDNLVS